MNIVYTQENIDVFSEFKDPKIEIEFRYGSFDQKNKFIPIISRNTFYRIQKYFSEYYSYEEENTVVQIDSKNNIRRIEYMNYAPETVDKEIIYQKKMKIMDIDKVEYGIRISASKEESIEKYDNFDWDYQRIRKRYSFFIPNRITKKNIYRIDLTEIMETSFTGHTSGNKYEIETELLDKEFLSEFFHFASGLFLVIHDTYHYYRRSDLLQLNHDIYELVNPGYFEKHIPFKGKMIQKEWFVLARNLKKADLTGNAFFKSSWAPMAVSIKADGLRKFLIIHRTGIWLCFPPFDFNLVIPKGFSKELDQCIEKYQGTLFDGELIDVEGNEAKAFFLIFDAVHFCYPKCVNLNTRGYEDRMKATDIFIKSYPSNSILTIQMKKYLKINNSRDFFNHVNTLLDEKDNLPYGEDGLIFTPIKSLYNPFVDLGKHKIDGKLNTLENFPSICKWKHTDELTIDFYYQRNLNGCITLKVGKKVGENYINVEFKGTPKHHFDESMIDHCHPLTQNLSTGVIVEYRVVFYDGLPLFVPKGIRNDKINPNKLEVAQNVFDDIMDPITEETIRGKNLKLVFNYHNQIKRFLLQSMEKGSILLDIGSGYGQDIGKWSQFSKIYATEPVEKNMIQLLERKASSFIKDKIEVYLLQGQDYFALSNIKGPMNVISSMLSLSFFWEKEYYVNGLAATIVNQLKLGGHFIFITVNGDQLAKNFEKSKKKKLSFLESSFSIGNAYQYQPYQNKVELEIRSSKIAEKQTEYFVYISLLIDKLKKHGFELNYHQIANQEELLTEEQKMFSSLYTYGCLTKVKQIPMQLSKDDLANLFIDQHKNYINVLLVLGLPDLQLDQSIYIFRETKLTNKKISYYASMTLMIISEEGKYQKIINQLMPEVYLEL